MSEVQESSQLQLTGSTIKEQLLSLAKASLIFYAFWFLIFQVSRSLFLWYYTDRLTDISASELMRCFWSGWPMDISTISYIFIFPLLLFISSLWLGQQKVVQKILKIYCYAMLAIVIVATMADMEVYSYWGAKLNVEAVSYLQHPKEALASAESSPLFALIFGIIVFFFVAFKIFNKFIYPRFIILDGPSDWSSHLFRLIFSITLIFLSIIGIRGGIGLAPMGGGHAYFSHKQILNHSATNATWNFIYSIQQLNWGSPCDYHFMEDELAQSYMDDFLYDPKIEGSKVINSANPNVVIIILEGWPAHITGAIGSEPGVTPFFDSLSSEGILFSNLYSSGDRTFKGIPSVLSGFPAFPSTSIIKYISKMEKLPCVAGSLSNSGYDTHFIYGGDIEFKSLSSYINHCGYDHITDQSDFDIQLALESKWGVHDHHMFEKAIEEIEDLNPPFLSTIVTLSSHEPYDVPMETKFPGKDRSEQFKNSVYYADWSLKQFFNQAKQTDWYDNTIFMMVSDHGRPYPNEIEQWMPEAFHIPALLYGEPIENSFRGKNISRICSQLDLVTTMLQILDIDTDNYSWGRNLANENSFPFAFYSFENGIGSVSPNGNVVYDRISGNLITPSPKELTNDLKLDQERQKAYLQSLCGVYSEL